ncbi:MAG: T9SS type A sorting domain-containing protein, partial [Bacteroidetes bacterium]|nr:T9SS type A sorting domain-containing protein [Bacteroidota bacterium]
TNNGVNWTELNNGLINKYVLTLSIIDSNIFAGIMGRGIYKAKLTNLNLNIVEDVPTNPSNKIIISPNPSYDIITIQRINTAQAKLIISNLMGEIIYQVIFESGETEKEFLTSDLSTGAYFIKIIDYTGKVETGNFIKY